MSQSRIAPTKSSPCCIGCVVFLIVGALLLIAAGFYGWRFAKENVALLPVADKADPVLDTSAEVLLPEEVGTFKRVSVGESLAEVPEMEDMESSGVAVGRYADPANNEITIVAFPTESAFAQRQEGKGPFTLGRGKANSSDVAFSIRDPRSENGSRTFVAWNKPNWSFLVQTTSTLASDFVRDFNPGGIADETTDTEVMAPTTDGDVVPTDTVEETTSTIPES